MTVIIATLQATKRLEGSSVVISKPVVPGTHASVDNTRCKKESFTLCFPGDIPDRKKPASFVSSAAFCMGCPQ
jgi:hypothetical protein